MDRKEITIIDPKRFDTTVKGKSISLYTLQSNNGITMQVTNYGGRIVALWIPDKNNKYADIVLGYDTIDKYINNPGERYLGSVIGRYANRIADGKFVLDGKEYQVLPNNNGNALHGGAGGFDSVVWNVDKVTPNEIQMSYLSPDGDEGFPGNLKIKMTYTLNADNSFKIQYEATTDKSTVVNLSHHSYFNLKGEGNGTILDNYLKINASEFIPINENSIPLKEYISVRNTPFDFRKPSLIGTHINDDDIQLKNGAGYDHCWIIDKETKDEIELAATVYEPISGRKLEVFTNQPGIQFYSSNWFDNVTCGKSGKPYKVRKSLALETQKFPNSPNRADFPSTRLNPGEIYKHTCIYKFSVE